MTLLQTRQKKSILILRHLAENLGAIFLLLFFSFLLLSSLPGNQADALLFNDFGSQLDAQHYTKLKRELGLDRPTLERFGQWLLHLTKGDLGYSLQSSAPISKLLQNALPWTMALLCFSSLFSLLFGSVIGLIAGMQPHKKRSSILFFLMTLLNNLPGFIIALLLLRLLAFTVSWFPAGGGASLTARLTHSYSVSDLLWHLLLPLTALTLHGCVHYFYLAYGLARQLNQRPFIRFARFRGIAGVRLLRNWYLPNAMPELLSRLNSQLPGMIGATVFVEVVFSYPGIGNLMLSAIEQRDYPLLQGIMLIFGILILTCNTVLDLLITLLINRG